MGANINISVFYYYFLCIKRRAYPKTEKTKEKEKERKKERKKEKKNKTKPE